LLICFSRGFCPVTNDMKLREEFPPISFSELKDVKNCRCGSSGGGGKNS